MSADTLRKCTHPSSNEPALILARYSTNGAAGAIDRIITHASLATQIAAFQGAMPRDLRLGGRVFLVVKNAHVFTVAFLALALMGLVVVPLNAGFKEGEFVDACEAGVRAGEGGGREVVLVEKEEVEKGGAVVDAVGKVKGRILVSGVEGGGEGISVEEVDGKDVRRDGGRMLSQEQAELRIQEPEPGHTALILHTSGTTGKPKAVPLTHGNLAASIANIIAHYGLGQSDRAPVIMPLFHIHGIVAGLLAPLAAGGAVIFSGANAGLTPGMLRDAAKFGATWFTATPTLHKLALQLPMPTQGGVKLRFVRSCSSRLEGGLLRQLENRYECPVVEAYAMTEAAHQMCSNPVSREKRSEGSVGKPTGVDVRIINEAGQEVEQGSVGEVAVKGKNVMKGYLGNEEANDRAFTKDGYFRTGDQGVLSEDGFLSLTGRLKEMINKGGEKISPVEIDEVVNKHSEVSEAVTFTIPDEMYGEDIGLAVVLKSGTDLTGQDLKAWIGERLMQAKVPKKVFLVNEIPKTPVGKMQRSLVAKTILDNGKSV